MARNGNGIKRRIDLLFGILAMERWGVDPDVQRKRIDLTHFKREFVEYSA